MHVHRIEAQPAEASRHSAGNHQAYDDAPTNSLPASPGPFLSS